MPPRGRRVAAPRSSPPGSPGMMRAGGEAGRQQVRRGAAGQRPVGRPVRPWPPTEEASLLSAERAAPPEPLMDDLNPEQRAAVEALPGPLLILAGAGSGKTRVLTRRLGHLIHHGADPYRVLAITFTNKAAREMVERVEHLLGPMARGMWVQTFHSACARILRREIGRFGYTPQFTILDGDDMRSAVREVLRELGYSDKMFPPNVVLSRISAAKNALRSPAAARAAAPDPWSRKVADAYEHYQDKLKAANSLDFDDLLGLTVRLLEEPDEAGGDAPAHEVTPTDLAATGVAARISTIPAAGGARYRALFRHVLVDEYQDTNHAQYRLIRALVRDHGSLTAVGDEDQSIYKFRGADRSNILRFEEDFPDARVIRLERNYRSTQAILDASGSVIGHNARRYPKKLWTDRGTGDRIVLYRAWDQGDEAAFVTKQIAELRSGGRGWGDFAILYRTHAQSRAVEEALLARGIPYVVVGGLKFYERKEVKDALAYLRLLCNPLDVGAFRRAVGAPRRGIGDATLSALIEHMASTGESLPSALTHAGDIPGASRAAKALAAFEALVQRLRGEAEGGVDGTGAPLPENARHEPAEVAETLASILDRSGLYAELRAEDTIESRARLENLQELLNVARQNAATVGQGIAGAQLFLEQASLIAEADNVPTGDGDPEADQGAVVLLTLHAAKGLEFPVVFLMGLEEGVFPHSRSLEDPDDVEEERRLCYVGMTRAKSRLFLSHARERAMYGGTPQPTRPSRFLAEIDPQLIEERRPQARGAGAGLWRPSAEGSGLGGRGGGQAAAPAHGSAFGGGGVRRGSPGAGAAAGAYPEPDAEAMDFAVGDRVVHARWGEGVVVSGRGRGPDGEVTVDFPDAGRRTLVLGYARLRRG